VKSYRWISLALTIVVLASMVTACGKKEATGESIAFTNVNVIPMDKERVLQDQTVIVRDARISEIGPASSTKVPAGATKIDGTGQYLIPALADMHVHIIIIFYRCPDKDFLYFLYLLRGGLPPPPASLDSARKFSVVTG